MRKTIEQLEAEESELLDTEIPRKKAGRPKGASVKVQVWLPAAEQAVLRRLGHPVNGAGIHALLQQLDDTG